MGNILKKVEANQHITSEDFGIEVKEVDFSEFDRRKTPRISNYTSFVKSLETSPIAIEFIV